MPRFSSSGTTKHISDRRGCARADGQFGEYSPGGGEGELVLTYPGVSSGRDPTEASAGFYEMPLSIESVPRQRLGSRPCWFSSKQADSIQSDHERAKSEEEIGIDSLGSVDQLFGDEQFLETVLLKTR
ncbi:MAG: hypothetical protein GY904_35715 [Planctomycetaceae bacterium]|nr:hypothetical protein [Planctomycetaceae bacterium]